MVRRSINPKDAPIIERTRNNFLFSATLRPEPVVSEMMFSKGEEFAARGEGILKPRPITVATSSGVIVLLSSSEESLSREE